MKPSMSAAAILVTTALRPSRPRRPRAALRSGSLDSLVRREISPACAQRAAMLISGGGFCFAQPPAVGKRSTAGGTELRFSSPVKILMWRSATIKACPDLTKFVLAGAAAFGGAKWTLTERDDSHPELRKIDYSWVRLAMGVLSLVQSAETGQRGYLLTNSQAYLIPYDRGTAAVGPAIDELGKLVIDNPQQTPHNGHSAMPPSDRTAKIIESDESLTLSITNPLGTSDEIRIPARMALIPPLENRKLGRKNHQM